MKRKLCLKGFIAVLLFFVSSPEFAFAEHKFSVGAMGGGSWGLYEDAVKGLPKTHFTSGGVYGGSIMYLYIPPSTPETEELYIADKLGFGLEICVESISIDFKESGENIGALKMTPILFLLKFQGVPPNGIGFSGHADIGIGVNLTDFEKSPDFTQREKANNVQYTIKTDDSLVYEVGIGTDYFFTRNIALTIDTRFLLTDVDTSWEKSGSTSIIQEENINQFQVSNLQLLVGVRYWF